MSLFPLCAPDSLTRAVRLALFGLSLASLPALILTPAQALAQSQTGYGIAAGPLGHALTRFGIEAGVTLSFDPEQIRHLQTTGLQGNYSVEEGLARLLANSGLQAQRQGNGGYVLVPVVAGSTVQLGATTIDAQTLGATTEGTGSYTAGSTSTATKMNLSIRETPQSISVVTRQRMDDQQLNSMSEVLNQTPGITISQGGGERYDIYSRGSEVTSYQFDGVTTNQENQTRTMPNTLLDMTLYDHVEVVRGAAGLMTGAGEPGGAVNLIRKKPTQEVQAHVQAGVGSWDYYRSEFDVSGPLTDSRNVRGRFVAAKQQNHSFMDWYSNDKEVLYGVVEADLSDTTLLRFGVDNQYWKSTGAPGVPLLFNNGQAADFSRSKSSGARWMYEEFNTTNYVLNLEQQLAQNWQLKVAANYMDVDRENLNGSYSTGSGRSWINQATGAADMLRYKAEAQQTQKGLDVILNGSFELGGRTHELVAGFNYQQYDNRHSGRDAAISSANFYTWDNLLPRPGDSGAIAELFNVDSRQRGSFLALKLNPLERLNVILGVRTSDYRYNYYYTSPSDNWVQSYGQRAKGVVTPYAGIVVDLTSEQSIYASYTDIFKPQSSQDRTGAVLDPIVGSNYEIGWKGEFYEGRLNASTAVYLIKRDNLAVLDTGYTVPGTTDSAYRAAKGAETKGIELEVSGELLPGWEVQTSYSHSRSEDAEGERLLTNNAMDTFRFWTTYRLPDSWSRLTLGGGVSWNSGTSLLFTRYNSRITQDDYALASLMARYRVTDHLTATLNVNNLFDEKYYSGMGGTYGHYGTPRNTMLNLRYDF